MFNQQGDMLNQRISVRPSVLVLVERTTTSCTR